MPSSNRSFILAAALSAAVLHIVPSIATAADYVWNGQAEDGIWQNGASQTNWVGGVYAPGNSGANTITFAASGYDTTASTITLTGGHNPNVTALAINSTVTTPLTLNIDGTNANTHLDLSVVTGTDSISVNAPDCQLNSVNGGTVQLFGGGGSWRVSGSNVFTVGATIIDTGAFNRGFVKQGAGTLVLAGANTFDGTLQAANGTVQLMSLANIGVNSAAGTGTGNAASATIQIGAANGFVGRLVYAGGDTSTNRPIQLTMSAAAHGPSYELSTTHGTLTLTGGIQTSTTGNIADPALFKVGGDGNMVVNTNGLFGFMTLNKIGAGRMTVNADSPYLGSTIVSAGTLVMDASHTPGAGSGTIEVQAGGTLGGTGTMLGNLTVDSGGTLRPGDGGGAFHASSPVDLEGNFTVDLSPTASNGELVAASSVTLGNASVLSIVSGLPLTLGNVYTIIDTPNALTGTFAGLTDGAILSDGNNSYRINYTPADVTLTVVVPEPATLAGIAVTTVGLLRRRRSSAKGL